MCPQNKNESSPPTLRYDARMCRIPVHFLLFFDIIVFESGTLLEGYVNPYRIPPVV